MNAINVVNLKCGGCEQRVKSELEKEGFTDIKVDVAGQKVEFEGDIEKAKSLLKKIGYPEAGSNEAKSLLKKGKSYLSCMIGRLKK